ncbi:MAG: tetratricopeptide repeat protein [bacterium]|nr:tetratricopeptide repeat protein [bacterium]
MASLFNSLFRRDPEAHLKKAESYAAAGQWGDARLALGKALNCFNDSSDPRRATVEKRYQEVSFRLASAHEEEGDQLARSGLLDRAAERYQLALGLFDADEDRRRVEEKLNRRPVEKFAEPVRLFGESHCANGQCAVPQEEGAFEGDPLDYFEVLMHTLEPSTAEAYRALGESFALGYAWMNQGETEKAIAYYEEALRDHDGQGAVHKELGRAHLLCGNGEGAASELARAREAMPQDREVALLLAAAFAEKGDTAPALEILEGLREANSDDPEIVMTMGDILFKSGDRVQARAVYESGLTMAPQSPVFHRALARCAAAQGEARDAIIHYTDAVKYGPHADDVLALADLMVDHEGDGEAVLTLLESALQRDAKNGWRYLVRMGEILIGAGRRDDAAHILTQTYDMIPGDEEDLRAQVAKYLNDGR